MPVSSSEWHVCRHSLRSAFLSTRNMTTKASATTNETTKLTSSHNSSNINNEFEKKIPGDLVDSMSNEQTSSLGGKGVIELEDCPICYDTFSNINNNEERGGGGGGEEVLDLEENAPNIRAKERLRIQGCRHEFCRECLTDHCQYSISVKAIPIACPANAQHDCENVLNDHLVKDLLCGGASSPLQTQAPPSQSPPPSSTTGTASPAESQRFSRTQQYGSISDDWTGPKDEETLENRHDASASPEPAAPSSPDWLKFQRFQRMLQDPSLVPCSHCQELVSPQDNEHNTPSTENISSSQNNENQHELTCQSCGHVFCRIHGDSHPQMSCEEYANSKKARQVKKSEKAIRRYTKPCSHCEAPIQKESGCDHIVCGSCHQDMCFQCGTHIHLSGDMIRSCEKCQQNFVDHRHIWTYRLTLCLSLPCYIPVCLVHILVVGLVAIATFGCCCCLGCGTQIQPKGREVGKRRGNDGANGNNSNNNNDSPRSAASGFEPAPIVNPGNDNTNSEKKKISFQPLEGMRVVLGIVFLPLVDLARQCGFRCCCELDFLSSGPARTMQDDDDDDEEDDDDEAGNVTNRAPEYDVVTV